MIAIGKRSGGYMHRVVLMVATRRIARTIRPLVGFTQSAGFLNLWKEWEGKQDTQYTYTLL